MPEASSQQRAQIQKETTVSIARYLRQRALTWRKLTSDVYAVIRAEECESIATFLDGRPSDEASGSAK
jgi:hypothetical protein